MCCYAAGGLRLEPREQTFHDKRGHNLGCPIATCAAVANPRSGDGLSVQPFEKASIAAVLKSLVCSGPTLGSCHLTASASFMPRAARVSTVPSSQPPRVVHLARGQNADSAGLGMVVLHTRSRSRDLPTTIMLQARQICFVHQWQVQVALSQVRLEHANIGSLGSAIHHANLAGSKG